MIEYTEIILFSNRLQLQPAKLLIEINIFWVFQKLIIHTAEKADSCRRFL